MANDTRDALETVVRDVLDAWTTLVSGGPSLIHLVLMKTSSGALKDAMEGLKTVAVGLGLLMPPFHDGCKCVYNPTTGNFETPGGGEYACPYCLHMRLREPVELPNLPTGVFITEVEPKTPIDPIPRGDLFDKCPKCQEPLEVKDLAVMLDPECQWAVRCHGCPCEAMGKTVKEAREAHRAKVEARGE